MNDRLIQEVEAFDSQIRTRIKMAIPDLECVNHVIIFIIIHGEESFMLI